MKQTNLYDINLYYPEVWDDSDLVVALYELYIDENGHLTTWTDEVYDSIVVPREEVPGVWEWAEATFGINMSLESDAWDAVSPDTPLPDPETAPKLRKMLENLPAYELYDRRDEK